MITCNDIRKFPVCQDPTNWISEDWTGELIDLYNLPNLDIDGKILMGVFFLSNEELQAFCDFCKTQCDLLVGVSDDFNLARAKCATFYGNGSMWFKAWYTAWYAMDAASKGTIDTGDLIRQAQFDYLKQIELNR